MQRKILIVDDIEEYLRSLENALSDEYEVITAKSLEEAKKKVSSEEVNIVLADIRLSEEEEDNRDGLVLLEWIKMNKPKIPIIMMSAYKEFDLAVGALNLGAEYFLKKPINLVELKGILKTVIKNEL